MNVKPIFSGIVKKGKLELDDPSMFNLYIQKFEDKRIALKIDTQTSKRTLNQNRFYWAYLSIIEDETGENANDLHELFKKKFIMPEFKRVLGEEVVCIPTTTEMDTIEFTNYITKIEALTTIPIPDKESIYI